MTQRNDIIDKLKTCLDLQIPVNVWDLGLIYDIQLENPEEIVLIMTAAQQDTEVANQLAKRVREALNTIPGLKPVRIEITFDPIWTPERMSNAAKQQLGIED